MDPLAPHRTRIRAAHLADEAEVLKALMGETTLAPGLRARAVTRATGLIEAIRAEDRPGLTELFLAEYGLSTEEGVALMCLAEALLRVPDAETVDALIEDKIAPSEWGKHLGQSSSPLVNASTWALLLTGRVLQEGQGVAAVLQSAVKRVGEPVIRTAVGRAIRELGAQFVLGRTITEAVERGRAQVNRGYSYSYDMLGEAAITERDAAAFFDAYADAIARLRPECRSGDIRDNPGISIKLSALHPRYEEPQRARVMAELVDRARTLARQARAAGMGLNIDAEEAARLDLSLDVIAAVLDDADLAGWDGFGVVVQAYGKRAGSVLDWLYALAEAKDRKLMVRLVKGAYWDTEIKRAQVEGLADFPVFTRKAATDVSYLCCAAKLLGMTDRIYPQFATHNAHTVAAIQEMAADPAAFEFQRLHGMGEALHDRLVAANATRCRIYAPVGAHRDLLAYLVRRLLENGANSSFVNQIVDTSVPASEIAADPFADPYLGQPNPAIRRPADLFAPGRVNARGWDLTDPGDLAAIDAARAPFQDATWQAGPLIAGAVEGAGGHPVANPANPSDPVGEVTLASAADVEAALAAAAPWDTPVADRAAILTRASDLYEANFGEFFALLAREAGKTPADAIAELREAVDFLRYYAVQAQKLVVPPRGVFTCISPWNFPLAIFTGQIAAALATGNAVLAKPAEATALTAHLAIRLLHQAGVPKTALQLLPGEGAVVGAALTSDPRVNGVCFTGSTATAQRINRSMAAHLDPAAPLIAETGGLNAMVVDSTALPEQAVTDIVTSAFRSAGQRCSALRMLYLQEDVAATYLEMLFGAMDELAVGDPWVVATDLGPVIDAGAKAGIEAHVAAARAEGRVVKELAVPEAGHFVPPTVIRLNGIEELEREVFGPVLHVATYKAGDLDAVLDAINATGYGLTFGMHSRIDARVAQAVSKVRAGNLYINRNQIGSIVGSQPFGGEGLSGTGPKAGGRHYLPRFVLSDRKMAGPAKGARADPARVEGALRAARVDRTALGTVSLPGPTGESNRLSVFPRGVVLCLGPTARDAFEQRSLVHDSGSVPILVAPGLDGEEGIDGVLDPAALETMTGMDAVALWGAPEALRPARIALASREGPIVPLVAERDLFERCVIERHVCIDTTAAGGNASLLAQTS